MLNCFTLTDDRFSADLVSEYDLTLEVQFSGLRFLVCSGEQILRLEDHFLGKANDLNTCLDKCSELMERHPVLSLPNWKSVRLVTDFEIFTLVPSDIFQAAGGASYLEFTYPTAPMTDFDVHVASAGNVQVTAATPRAVRHCFSEHFPAFHPVSAAAVAVDYLEQLPPDTALGVLSDAFLTLCYRREKNRALAVEKIPLRQLADLPPVATSAVFFGEITSFGNTYLRAQNAFSEVKIGHIATPPGLSDSTPWHRYFTLLLACRSPIAL